MKPSELSQVDKLDVICALSGWLGGALWGEDIAEIPPLAWWEDIGMDFTENANTIVGNATEMYTIPEMIDVVKRLAATL